MFLFCVEKLPVIFVLRSLGSTGRKVSYRKKKKRREELYPVRVASLQRSLGVSPPRTPLPLL